MIKQPVWPKLLPSSVVVGVATLGVVGRLKAPGTWGSLAGVLWYTVFFMHLHPIAVMVGSLLLLYLGVAFCGEAEVRLAKVDPGEIVLDEFVAIPWCFFGLELILATSNAWMVFVAGFLLFRLFDILKPFGINRLQRYRGGIGVVADDLAAALATCVVLNVVFRLVPLP
ncbi:MAG: phosphatidylglycerophosphatase A [Puniceicoccaceae bacterium]|nr:MAG: phosphatidylglycerophosphatase A [Puniceicoccaceae bacterium]